MRSVDGRRWGWTTVQAITGGLIAWFGTAWRWVNIEHVGASWTEAAREMWPVAPFVATVVLGLEWLIPAFNRRFPRRTD